MRVFGIIAGILVVQSAFILLVIVNGFGSKFRPDHYPDQTVYESILFVGYHTTPLCISGFIAFLTAKKFGKLGFWIICSVIAIGWGYVIYHHSLGTVVTLATVNSVILMGSFTIATGIGLVKASRKSK